MLHTIVVGESGICSHDRIGFIEADDESGLSGGGGYAFEQSGGLFEGGLAADEDTPEGRVAGANDDASCAVGLLVVVADAFGAGAIAERTDLHGEERSGEGERRRRRWGSGCGSSGCG
jgi:hypothetical protein